MRHPVWIPASVDYGSDPGSSPSIETGTVSDTDNNEPASDPTKVAISVIVCTKDRADSAPATITSILADTDPRLELIVIDQSDDDATTAAIEPITDSRLRYRRSTTRGKGAAMNEAVTLARSAFAVFTDDDCTVDVGWSSAMVQPMRDDDDIALIFSQVVAPPYDTSSGYIPAYEFEEDRLLSSVLDVRHGWGLGAGMAVRLSALQSIDGLDTSFGPGSRFPSADDLDLELRFLARGHQVFESRATEVVHHGFRTWHEGRAHTVRDWQAIGASLAKLVRAGHFSAFVLGASIIVRLVLVPSVREVVKLRRPPLRRLTALIGGAVATRTLKVDRASIKFEERPSNARDASGTSAHAGNVGNGDHS